MSPIVRNVLAVVSGLVVGSIVNMGIITIAPEFIPPPEGIDVANMEDLKSSMHLFEPKNFIGPFLAHALGTFFGAFIAAKFSANYHMYMSFFIGGLFLIGGIMMVISLPAPAWFEASDLILAYLPAAWIGWKLSGKP